MANKVPHPCPTRPGERLREDIHRALGRSRTAIVQSLGISRRRLGDVLGKRKSESPELAVRLAKICGGSIESWLRMQNAHDIWHVERSVNVGQVPRLIA